MKIAHTKIMITPAKKLVISLTHFGGPPSGSRCVCTVAALRSLAVKLASEAVYDPVCGHLLRDGPTSKRRSSEELVAKGRTLWRCNCYDSYQISSQLAKQFISSFTTIRSSLALSAVGAADTSQVSRLGGGERDRILRRGARISGGSFHDAAAQQADGRGDVDQAAALV